MSIENPTLWEQPLGYQADVQTEIQVESQPLSNEVTFADIFPLITSMPLAAGGLRPSRLGINALFKMLGDNVYFLQRGGVYTWDASIEYEEGAIILHDGQYYRSLRDSNTGHEPGTDYDYWENFWPGGYGLEVVDNMPDEDDMKKNIIYVYPTGTQGIAHRYEPVMGEATMEGLDAEPTEEQLKEMSDNTLLAWPAGDQLTAKLKD